jgi:hypothetical protein
MIPPAVEYPAGALLGGGVIGKGGGSPFWEKEDGIWWIMIR